MRDTSVGLRADLKPRKVVPDFRGNYPIGHKSRNVPGPNGAFEDETGRDALGGRRVHRAGHVPLRRHAAPGRHAGRRAPAVAGHDQVLAARNWTGDKVNELYAQRGRAEGLEPAPAYIGLGFSVRGEALCPT